MQTNVGALVSINMDGDFRARLLLLAIYRLQALRIGPYPVVRLACGKPLGKLPAMVGVQFPFRFLLIRAPDVDPHTIHGTVVGPPHRSKDQGVGLARIELVTRSLRNDWREDSKQEKPNEQPGNAASVLRDGHRPAITHHRLRFPRLLLRPLPLLRLVSVRGD